MFDFTLSADQERAYKAFCQLIQNPNQSILVIEGFAGVGKTALVKKCLADLPKIKKTLHLLHMDVKLEQVFATATTNKAADALKNIANIDTQTIYSLLGLQLRTNYMDMSTTITLKRNAEIVQNAIIFIDEAGMINHQLLQYIFSQTKNCKLVFIGDPAQLTDIKSKSAPVFTGNYPKVTLSEIIRQPAGNPILDLATAFRTTVNTGEFFQFKPDGNHIQILDREDFDQAIIEEFTRPSWREPDSRVLAWTNKRVVSYNQGIYKWVKGNPRFQAGDYTVCNRYVPNDRQSIKTDQTVYISEIVPGFEYNVPGHHVRLDHGSTLFFLPDNFADKKAAIKQAQKSRDFALVKKIDQSWIDLRALYASTINKAQGSTFERVFIDLDDIKRCTNGNQLARLLYVAVSRARNQVLFTGDLV